MTTLTHVKLLCTTLIIFSAAGLSSARSTQWQSYVIPEQNIAIMMPNLPTVSASRDECTRSQSKWYYAYSDEAIYSLVWHSEAKDIKPGSCSPVIPFSKQIFLNR